MPGPSNCGASMPSPSSVTRKPPRGVVTHSSGNHGGHLLWPPSGGVSRHVVVPQGTTKRKVEAMTQAGAELHWCDDNQAAREAACGEVCARTGAELVHPYDDARVVAGNPRARRSA